MKLVVFGDSNAAGSEACNDYEYDAPHNKLHAYGALVAEKLNMNYENLAQGGATNTEIINSVFNWINSNVEQIKDTLILIGWTEPGRFLLNKPLLPGKSTCDNITRNFRQLLSLSQLGATPFTITLHIGKMWHTKVYINDPHIHKLFEKLEQIDPTSEFSRIFVESIANSDETLLTHFLSIVALDQHLQKLNANYLAFPALPFTLPSHLNCYYSLLASKNNITEYDYIEAAEGVRERFDYIGIFSRYGRASGGHLTAPAHRVVAQWLATELKQRQII